jgi:hypothetical protein
VVADEPDRWPTVAGSDSELTRVVSNLLSNATRHTPAGAVALSAGTTGAEAWLRAEDACGGIPDADLDRIFDIGYRGAAARTPARTPGRASGWPSHAPSPKPTAPAIGRELRPGLPLRAHPATASSGSGSGPDTVSSTKLRAPR